VAEGPFSGRRSWPPAPEAYRPGGSGIWSSGRRLSVLWALATLGPQAMGTRLKALAADHQTALQIAA
jgi:hypothetical protein